MIVCSCNVFTDHDVRAALAGKVSPHTVDEVYSSLGFAPRCGRCRETIRDIMGQAAATPPRQPENQPAGRRGGANSVAR